MSGAITTNGTTLGYKTTGTTYTILTGLKEVPDIGAEPEQIENTRLSDTTKHYEVGIGDAPDVTYVFEYDNSSATTAFRLLSGFADARTVVDFEETFGDGTKFQYKAIPSVTITGGAYNSMRDIKVKMTLQTAVTRVDPV